MLRFLCLKDRVDDDAFNQGRKYSPNVSCFNKFHLIAADPQLPPQSFHLMYPPTSKSARVMCHTTHVPSHLLRLPLTHICYLESNLEQLPQLPPAHALSMTMSRTLCLNDPKASMFTTREEKGTVFPRWNTGQKQAHL